MTPYNAAPAAAPRNALVAAAQPSSFSQPQAPTPSNLPVLLASTIGHAALLSDTPAKWESTIAMLKQHGVDPHGFEDFQKGRLAAMAAVGMQPPQAEEEQG